MLLQRYKIQLENYQVKKNNIIKQLKPINDELNIIDEQIKNEIATRNNVWRELLKKSRQLALPDPPPITNFKKEISNTTALIEQLTNEHTINTTQLENLKRKLQNHYETCQNMIDVEVNIHKEEKERILAKYCDYNNDFVNLLYELISLQEINNIKISDANKQLENVNQRLIECKNIENANRDKILQILRISNNLRREYLAKVSELNAEITQLTSEADEIARQRDTFKTRLSHLTQLQFTMPDQYSDLIPEVNDLQYKIQILDKQIIRLTTRITELQYEIKNTNLQEITINNSHLQPIQTPYKDLICQKNNQIQIINNLKDANTQLESQINTININYHLSYQQLVTEDARANYRLQTIIDRNTTSYANTNDIIDKQITKLLEHYTNLKQQIYLKKKELDNWNSAYQTECTYEFKKTQLLQQQSVLQSSLKQIENDILAINNIININ